MFRFTSDLDFSEYTFIIPSISVGNVGQLTCDLLISTFNLTKIATAWHPAIIPIYGPNPFDKNSSDNCVACELYACQKYKFVVFQIRSTIEPCRANLFFDELKATIVEKKFKQVLIIGSSFAYELKDFSKSYFRYVTNTKAIFDIMTQHKIPPMEVVENNLLIHGGGFAVKLYENLKDKLNCSIILKYVSEGDNRADAVSMLEILSICFNIPTEEASNIRYPISWELLFGGPPPTCVY